MKEEQTCIPKNEFCVTTIKSTKIYTNCHDILLFKSATEIVDKEKLSRKETL
jgi:hypothetical protein